MSFWDLFTTAKSTHSTSIKSGLYYKIKELLPTQSEEELIKFACLAGLLARIAYMDYRIDKAEKKHMKKVLIEWAKVSEADAEKMVTLSLSEIKELSGLENHLYCHPLNEVCDISQKNDILKCLFALAASDNSVSELESEEIRLISKGLLLDQKDFVAAKLTVIDKLNALKNNP